MLNQILSIQSSGVIHLVLPQPCGLFFPASFSGLEDSIYPKIHPVFLPKSSDPTVASDPR